MFRLHGCPEDDTLFLSELLYSSEQQSIYEIPVLIMGEELVGSEFFDCRPGVGSAGAVLFCQHWQKNQTPYHRAILLILIISGAFELRFCEKRNIRQKIGRRRNAALTKTHRFL